MALLASLVACGGGGTAPDVDPVADQLAQVGVELRIEIRATDSDGDPLTYAFSADVPDIASRASIGRSPNGIGVFRWTPLGADVGVWHFDFTVSDGGNETTVPVRIDVRSAIGSNSAPKFRAPLGSGTTLDLSTRDCIDLQVLVDDQDSASVTIAQEEPVIEGAALNISSGLAGTWHWCPTDAQIAAEERYVLTLSADDESNPKTVKSFLIVLRRGNRTDCPGDAPVISHSPTNENTLVNLTVPAVISDDQGLKQPPLFYYSTSAPGSTPDLSAMTQLTMLLIDGDAQNGTWAADVPNPAVTMPVGSQVTLYYLIVADDDDDAIGNCDHTTTSPSSGTYSMQVTNPGGEGNAGICISCVASIQCGSGDLCVRVGSDGDTYCLEGCTSDSDCPADYTCSQAIEAIEGTMARQCVPDSGTCRISNLCQDDSYEDNDSRTQADGQPAIEPGQLNATSCPLLTGVDDDEDWYKLEIASDANVALGLSGGDASDLDIDLYDGSGAVITRSTAFGSNDNVATCLVAGDYYARVYAWGAAENPYTLSFLETPTASCASACMDDGEEQDDDAFQARLVTFPSDNFANNVACPNDDDWYFVLLENGETLTVDLTFNQVDSSGDLDLHFYDEAGTDLTPCTPFDPSTCDSSNGQSADSNETMVQSVSSGCAAPGCTYYVVVRGYDSATNDYNITFAIQ